MKEISWERLKQSTNMPNVVDHTYEHIKVDTKSLIPATIYVCNDEKGMVNSQFGAKIWDTIESTKPSYDVIGAY